MSATASRNSKEAFDNLIWGFNLGPRFPSIGLNRTTVAITFVSLIRVDHENLKLLRPKTKINKIWTIWTNFDSPWAPKWTPMPKNIAQIISYSKYDYILKIWGHYDQRQKFWNFDNFDQLWESLGPPNGPLHQKLLHKWFHIANMNTFWKFEASTTKDKNFEILAIFGPP